MMKMTVFLLGFLAILIIFAALDIAMIISLVRPG